MEDGHRITEDILRETVASELGLSSAQEVNIKSFEVTGGSNKGDGYACVIKAVEVVAEVKGEEKTLYYMAKCMPLNEFRAKMLEEANMFDTEIAMYTKIVPALAKLGKRLSAPLTFYASSDLGVIMMENLKKKDYFLIDKEKGLDMFQVKLVLEQLALLHATSYHYIETYPNGGLAKFKEEFPNMTTLDWLGDDSSEIFKQFIDMIAKQLDLFIAVMEENCLGNVQLVQKLKKFALVREEKLKMIHRPQGKFNCILHSDAWFNNFMFGKNDSGETDRIKILDLQASRRARPTVDLTYFFGSSTTPEFRRDHLEEMLHFYHSILTQSLKSCGHDGTALYPYEQLKKDYWNCYPFGFIMSQMHTLMHLKPADQHEDAIFDFNNLSKDNNLTQMMAKVREGQLRMVRENETIRNRLISLALEVEEMGVI